LLVRYVFSFARFQGVLPWPKQFAHWVIILFSNELEDVVSICYERVLGVFVVYKYNYLDEWSPRYSEQGVSPVLHDWGHAIAPGQLGVDRPKLFDLLGLVVIELLWPLQLEEFNVT
jgi:hypothetical protein